jgi:hypothetical protein
MKHSPETTAQTEASDDTGWFRPPTVRERRIAGWLFLGFGVFFAVLFVLHAGWWFRWVILALSIISLARSIYDFFGAEDHRNGR